MEGEPDTAGGGAPDIGALGGTPGDGTPGDGTPGDGGSLEPPASIYGDLQVQWPEGMDNTLHNDVNLKPFVGKEGSVNYANLMKSYVHQRKMVGADTVTLPNENWDDGQRDDFWGKLGATKDANEIKFENPEGDNALDAAIVEKFKNFAIDNRIPANMAGAALKFMQEETVSNLAAQGEATAASIKEGLDSVKAEWGQAYEQKLGLAQRVLNEVVKDDSINELMKNPTYGSNPQIMKMLAGLGEKLFKEDTVTGGGSATVGGKLSPAEAKEEIGRIMKDRSHPYFLKDHGGHEAAVKKVQDLFEMKRG